MPDTPDTFQLRRAYTSIDQTWHHLQTQLANPAPPPPPWPAPPGSVAEIDAEIHQRLGLNAYPTNYFTTTRPLTGLTEVQRLAHALVDRAEALAAVVRADMVGTGRARLVQDAVNLAQAADAFHDGIDVTANPDLARNGFADVSTSSEVLRKDLAAIQKVIKLALGEENARKTPVSSTKGATGHCLGASGAVEAIFSILAVNKNVMPPTINYETLDPKCDLDYIPNEAREAEVKVAVSNSFGFGGHNACIVLRELAGEEPSRQLNFDS